MECNKNITINQTKNKCKKAFSDNDIFDFSQKKNFWLTFIFENGSFFFCCILN